MPERIGRYDVLLPIASGGMATVYLARTRSVAGFERQVAIKLMHPFLREIAEFSEQLLEEAKLTAQIRHPNVVTCTDVGEDPFGMYLVMDYIEGDSLAGMHRSAVARGETLPVAIGLRVLIDSLGGLHAAHELQDEDGRSLDVVHRDFSPQNILLGVDGIGRLTDFGIAKAASRIGTTVTGVVKGKVSYMAPEQARAEALDRRCDVWAAGVTAWQILAGRRLHPADGDVATLMKIVSEAPPRLRDVAPHVPRELDEAVAWALTLDVNARCPTAKMFQQSLTAACRANGLWVESDAVAEYIARVEGPKLAERRATVRRLVSGNTEATHEHPTVVVGEPLHRDGEPAVLRAWDAGPATAPTSTVAGGAAASAAPPVETNSGTVRIASTITASSSQRGDGRGRVLRNAGLGVLLASVLSIPLFLRPRAPETAAARAATSFEAKPSAAPSSSIWISTSVPVAPPPEPPEPPASSIAAVERSLTLHANALVTALRVDGRMVPVGHASRDVTITLSPDEAAQAQHVEAFSADGRRASGVVPAGATSAPIAFAPKRALPSKSTDDAPPLLPLPYGQHR
jgi:serine/threonine-protein kinase